MNNAVIPPTCRNLADLLIKLRTLHERTAETPLFNPVFQLSLDISRAIESGALTLEQVGSLVSELECTALKSRAELRPERALAYSVHTRHSRHQTRPTARWL